MAGWGRVEFSAVRLCKLRKMENKDKRKILFEAGSLYSRRRFKVYLVKCTHCKHEQQTMHMKDVECPFCKKKFDVGKFKLINSNNNN